MNLRADFHRMVNEAAEKLISSEACSDVATDTGYNTSSSPSLHSATDAGGRGRGRASYLTANKDLQTSSERLGPPLPMGRGKFLHVLRDFATEKPNVDVDAVAEDLSKVSLEEENSAVSRIVAQSTSAAEKPAVRTGTSGTSATLLCNFMELRCDPNRGIFLYTVHFQPDLDSKTERRRCIDNNAHIFGKTHTFDGALLLLPQALPDNVTIVQTKHPINGSNLTMTVTFRVKKRLGENVLFYNKLFRRIMNILQLSEIGRKNFDPTQARIVPEHKLEVWPGFVTAVNEFEGGLMLNLDITHRVLMQTTVHDHMKMITHTAPQQFRENVMKSLLGAVVMTRYNKKTYRIDDVCFDWNPLSTFRYGESDISYMQYYRQQYGIEIKDQHQPLLLHRSERRIAGQSTPEQLIVCLVPEICHLTGMTDELRNDFKVMRDIAAYTRVSPNQRIAAMEKFCQNVNTNEKARTLLASWGLELIPKAKPMIGRTLPTENIRFGNNGVTNAGQQAEFNNQITNHHMLEVVHIRNWLLVHTSRDTRAANIFIDCVQRNSRLIGIDISPPQTEVLQQDSTQLYVQLLRTRLRPETQIVVIICPTIREDRYAAIKRICCTEVPIPSQIITVRSLMNDKRVRSIVLKIILQMNCKLGGTLWGVKIPLTGTMVCGIDTYHETQRKNASVSAFVGSLDPAFTHWYSRATVQSCKEELMNGLCVSLGKTLEAYRQRNCQLPERIIIFRDGVSDSQTFMCGEYEIPQLEAACHLLQPGYKPKITFLVVQKRIITRMFAMNRSDGTYSNPPPGTVLDHSVTRRYQYDFFLVAQSVRQGTVAPTHYIVLRDDSAFAPDILQRLSYKLCYMYYNWPGTVRVPACCQYAHKLAYLVGQMIKRMPAETLCDKLFYL